VHANCLHIVLVQANGILTSLVQARNFTGFINGLSGTVDINCSISGGTISCQFLQDTISSAFGSGGLQMVSCSFGECVRQNVIDFLTSDENNSTPTNTSSAFSEGTHLSGGVIAGLAIVGGMALIGILLVIRASRAP
jgi:hypothetical protein